ncbi:hypothetical protein [Micromonospora okii]|uniref:hypothetical protein n=1 Tax=Micromonospora okii TaxID=1182970 RepID=UPI001E2C4278|nr:hypothetical protein [Micromonospora okii]
MERRRSSIRPTALAGGLLALALAVSPPAAPVPPAPMPVSAAVPVPAADAPAGVERWAADLSAVGADDVNVRFAGGRLRLADRTPRPATRGARDRRAAPAEGAYLSRARDLARPATRVRAEVAADVGRGGAVEVQVRGWGSAGWTEWRPADPAAVFDRPVDRVQARVLLTARTPAATPSVRAVRLAADRDAADRGAADRDAADRGAPDRDAADRGAPAVAAATPGLTYRVYATRIGLVGARTANGRTIQSRDHFVALPSFRSLAPLNSGDYTVRVCTTGGSRCEYAPVWDVGPWNTRDDYWNPGDVRENWKDLPQGRPEAQAAYQSGYNGGRDQYGRTVGSPAGIDLADGTFWDGLQLTDNAWVDVAYLWTGTGARGVVGSGPLTLRAGPGTSYAARGLAATYARVPIQCHVTGQTVTGTFRTTNRWHRLTDGQYVSDAYISTLQGTPTPC